jgi:hypothetical protein
MVSSQTTMPVFSQVVPRAGILSQEVGSASTTTRSRASSTQPSPPLEDGPTTTPLTEHGIQAVHDFLVTHGANYEAICRAFPEQTRAMEIAWIVTGVQRDGLHTQPHPAFVANLKSRNWKPLRDDLKNLMFDTVSSSV